MKETLANNSFPPQINSYQRKLEAIIVQLATCYDEFGGKLQNTWKAFTPDSGLTL